MSHQAIIDGKSYDFEGLVPFYGTEAVGRLTRGWTRQFVGYKQSTCSVYYRTFTRFLRWIAARAETAENSVEAAFFRAIQEGGSFHASTNMVHGAAEAWASRLRDAECFEVSPSTSLMSRRSLLDSVAICLRKLARDGLWADPGKVEPVARGMLAGGNIPSFGELAPVAEISQLRGWVKPTYDNLDWHQVIRLNEDRLRALRDLCQREFKSGLTKWERGQAFLNDPDAQTPRSAADLQRELIDLGLRRVTHLSEELMKRRVQGLSLMVRYLALVEPHRRSFQDWRGTPLADHGKAAGGWLEALAHVEGTLPSLIAAHTIIMIDTAFNVSTCDALAADPFVSDMRRGKLRIVTVAAAKLRARGEIQEGDLPEGADVDEKRLDGNLSAASVIRSWRRMSERVRATARGLGLEASDLLWIAPGYKSDRDRISTPSTAAIDHHWQAMLGRVFHDPVLGGLPIRRQMIRPTVLQLEAARGNFEHTVAARAANHRQSVTTMRYLSRPWFKALMSSKMRTYLAAFEASLAEPIAGAPEALGNSATHQASLEHATSTGLGFLCAYPRGALVDQAAAPACTDVDRCSQCSFRQFRPTSEAIRALLLFDRSLSAAEDRFIARNPARWAEVWMDSQALCQAIAAKLRETRHRALLMRLEAEVDGSLADGSLQLLDLW